jgi:hypothetical protein
MELDGTSLLAILKDHMDLDELRTLAKSLNVDWDCLSRCSALTNTPIN